MFLNLLGQLPSTNSAPPENGDGVPSTQEDVLHTCSKLESCLDSPGFGDALIFSRHEVLVFVFILLRRRSMSRRGFGSRKCHFLSNNTLLSVPSSSVFLSQVRRFVMGRRGWAHPDEVQGMGAIRTRVGSNKITSCNQLWQRKRKQKPWFHWCRREEEGGACRRVRSVGTGKSSATRVVGGKGTSCKIAHGGREAAPPVRDPVGKAMSQ